MGLLKNLYDRFITKPVAESILKSINAQSPQVTPLEELQTFAVPMGFNNQFSTYNKRMLSAGSIDWTLLRSLSINHETTRAAINVRKREITQLGYEVVDLDDDTDSEHTLDERNEARNWITHIGGTGVRFREILDKLIEDTLVLDACVFYKQRTLDGELFRIIPIDGATIKLRVDENGMRPQGDEIAFEQWLSGKMSAELTTEELSYEMMNARSDNPYGLSPIESLIISLDASMRAMLYNLAYLSDNSVPQGFLNVPENWKLPAIKEYTEYLHSLISGPKMQAKIFPIPSGATYTPVSKPSDFTFKDFFDYLDRKVCMMFDVTPQELGLSLQQYKENAEGQEKIQIRKGIKPLANFLSEIFTDLLQQEGGWPNFAFKFTGLDMRFSLDEAKTLVPLGILGIDEYRNDMGLKKLGVDPFVVAGNNVVPVSKIGQIVPQGAPLNQDTTVSGNQQPGSENTDMTAELPENIDLDPETEQSQQKMEKILSKIEKNAFLEKLEASPKYKAFLKSVQGSIKKQLKPFTKEEAIADILKTGKATDYSNVDEQKLGDYLPSFNIKGFDTYLKWAAGQGGQNAYDSLRIKGSFALNNQKFDEMLGDRENYLIDSVDDTTKQYIVDQLSQGHASGLTNAEIAQQIASDVDEVSLSRANTITNTETANATQTAELDTYKEQGVTKKHWVLSEDIGDMCGENADEGAIDVNDNFSSGDDAPPAHPNCRCFLQADIESIKYWMPLKDGMHKGWVTINGAHVLIGEEATGIRETLGGRGTQEKSFTQMTEPEQLAATERGDKPIAMIPDFNEKGYQSQTLRSINIPQTQIRHENGKVVSVSDFPMKAWFQPQNEEAANQLASIYNTINAKLSNIKVGDPISSIPPITAAEHTQIGRLLGYSPQEVFNFVQRIGAKMQKGWVTINGAHVLIGDDGSVGTGGGNGPFSTKEFNGLSESQINAKVAAQVKGNEDPNLSQIVNDYNWSVSTIPLRSIANIAGADAEEVNTIAQQMRTGVKFPPPLVTNINNTVEVIDGNHRLEAAKLNGVEEASVLLGRAKS